MARQYAAVLGLLAFTTVLIRAAVSNAAWNPALSQAIACLVVFAIVGAIGGWMAEQIIDDALRTSISEEIATQQTSGTKSTGK